MLEGQVLGNRVGIVSTYVGNVIVARIPPPQVPLGSAKVSDPVQGAPPKGFCWMLTSQRWQSCLWPPALLRNSGSPTIIRKPFTQLVSHMRTYGLNILDGDD